MGTNAASVLGNTLALGANNLSQLEIQMDKKKAINSTSRPVPSSVGSNIVHYDNLQAKKGSGTLDSKLPEKLMIKEGKK